MAVRTAQRRADRRGPGGERDGGVAARARQRARPQAARGDAAAILVRLRGGADRIRPERLRAVDAPLGAHANEARCSRAPRSRPPPCGACSPAGPPPRRRARRRWPPRRRAGGSRRARAPPAPRRPRAPARGPARPRRAGDGPPPGGPSARWRDGRPATATSAGSASPTVARARARRSCPRTAARRGHCLRCDASRTSASLVTFVPLPQHHSAARRENPASASIPRSGGGERQELGQRRLDALGHEVEVGQRVVVAEQPEAHLAVVGHDRDGKRALTREEGHREDLRQPPAEHVERELRAGHVGHEEVEEAPREVQARGLRVQGGRREPLERGDRRRGQRLPRLLQPVHRLLDVLEPRDGVVEEHGQGRHDLRELVAQRAPLFVRAHGDRDRRLELDPLRPPPARLEEVGERPGHDREHDVVDRGAEGVLDLLELVEARAHDRDAPVRPGRDVERRGGRRVEGGHRDLADARRHLARALERLPGARDRADRARGDAGDRADGALHAARSELRAARLPVRDPGRSAVAVAGGAALLEVEEHRREVHPGEAVEEGVVGLRDQRPPTTPASARGLVTASLAPLDEPQLPQRLGAVQALGEDAPAQVQQRVLRPRRRQRAVPHVVGQVEGRVVDPQRPPRLERRRRQLLPVARHQMQPRLDVREELVERRRRAVEEREPADVHVRVRLLLRQEGRVHGGEPVQMLLRGHASNSFRSMTDSTPSRTALITGCSSGIGRATAKRLAGAGWTVYATARRPEKLADLEARGCRTLALDVTDEASMRAAVEAVEAAHGAVGVLVNNAGYSQNGAIETVPIDKVRAQFETNVFGLVRMCQLLLPGMRRARTGKIVNLSSMGGRLVFPGGGFYHATKYAVEAISDALRFEVKGFGIDVVIVQPGLIRSGFADAATGAIHSATPAEGPYAQFNAAVAGSTQSVYERGPLAKLGGEPDTVARTIERAITARMPKIRYRVTPSARLLVGQRALMTDRMWDRMLATQFPHPGGEDE